MPALSLLALRPEYLSLAATMTLSPDRRVEARRAANRLLGSWDAYAEVELATGVPKVITMCINERESGGRLDTYLGNGQLLSRRTTIVPIGRGPFPTFLAGAIDAYTIQGMMNKPKAYWDVATLCFWMESFNGFGYRKFHNIRSPYLWGGTNHQQPGKYIADAKFDASVLDPQLGGMAVYAALTQIHPELTLQGAPDA